MNVIPILYENDEIYVINKPSGLSVQGGQGVTHSLDVDFSNQIGQKVYLVHRLDKDTCGLMIVAKSAVAANKWTKLVGSKIACKEYIAICAGSLKQKKGVIKDTVEQHGETKSAVTQYEIEKEWTVNIPADETKGTEAGVIQLSQIRLKLETGRMHQIRIHLAKQNCPIAGDDQHGNFKLNKQLKKYYKIKRFLLCSQKLTLPVNGKNIVFEIDLPQEFSISSI